MKKGMICHDKYKFSLDQRLWKLYNVIYTFFSIYQQVLSFKYNVFSFIGWFGEYRATDKKYNRMN